MRLGANSILVFIILMFSGHVALARVYDCVETNTYVLGWTSAIKDLELTGGKSKNGLKLSLHIFDKTAIVKIGSSETILNKIDENSFIETTVLGGKNVLWRLIPSNYNKPTVLFILKGYESLGPVGVMSSYHCK